MSIFNKGTNIIGPRDFSAHVLDIFDAMRPKKDKTGKYSTDATLKDLYSRAPITTRNATYSKEDITNVLNNFYNLPRYRFTKDISFGELCPLGLYLFKSRWNICYNRWQRSDQSMPLFMGKTLEPLVRGSTVPCIVSQTGDAGVGVRDEKTMILDCNNWDSVPESLDAEVVW